MSIKPLRRTLRYFDAFIFRLSAHGRESYFEKLFRRLAFLQQELGRRRWRKLKGIAEVNLFLNKFIPGSHWNNQLKTANWEAF